MIQTSRQLKALVRNMSKGDSNKALVIIRNYVMERFLERLSLSPYRDHMILKGGILVAAILGLDNRSTLDLDAAIKKLPLSVENACHIVQEIISIPVNDGMTFSINAADTIMDEADYTGVRIILDATLDTMHTPLKIDFSTGDVITPGEISNIFKLMFEDRTISILTYNLETLLAEKLETLITRGTANTRMRDFYDIYALMTIQPGGTNPAVINDAFMNTCRKRGSVVVLRDAPLILDEVDISPEIAVLWKNYQDKFTYASGARWADVMKSVRKLYEIASQTKNF